MLFRGRRRTLRRRSARECQQRRIERRNELMWCVSEAFEWVTSVYVAIMFAIGCSMVLCGLGFVLERLPEAVSTAIVAVAGVICAVRMAGIAKKWLFWRS